MVKLVTNQQTLQPLDFRISGVIQVTFKVQKECQDWFISGKGLMMDRLKTLRAYLEHFEQSPDFGDRDSVEQIRRHLLLRIRETESSMQCRDRLELRSEAA